MENYERREKTPGDKTQKTGWEDLEAMADFGGKREKVEWDDLAEVPMVKSEEVNDKYEELWRANQDFIRAQMEAQGEDGDEYEKLENPKLELMRKHWGDFAASRELFADNTAMSEYDYGILAKHYSWDDFVKFADKVYEQGQNGENYEDTLLEAGDDLYHDKENPLAEWRSLGLAVRRYNTAKHYGDMPPEARFYTKVAVDGAKGLIQGRKLYRSGLELGYDGDDEANEERVDPDGNMKVTLVLDQDIIRKDDFDPMRAKPRISNLADSEDIEAILTENVFMQKKLLEMADKSERNKHLTNKIMKVEDWLAGKREVDWDKLDNESMELWDRTFRRIGGKEMRKRVGEKADKADKTELKKLIKQIKADPDSGVQETANYFGQLLGIGDRKIEYMDKKEDGDGDSVGTKVYVNRKLRKRPKKMMGVIAHEMWHQYQSEIAERWRRDELEKGSEEEKMGMIYNNNRAGYKDLGPKSTGGDELIYGLQLYEREAENFRRQVKKKLR